MRNYFRRDESLKQFFARAATWDPALDNYGFEGEDADTKADSLEGLLDTIAGFMPGPYLTAKITKQTKCMQDVFTVIWDHYDVQPNSSTFLEFADFTLFKDERYIDLYYRMTYHAEMHLVTAGTMVEGKNVDQDEKLTHSHRNLIALHWLMALSPDLVTIVKLEKHHDLKDGRQLHTLVNDISRNIDEWLKRHGGKMTNRSREAAPSAAAAGDAAVRNVRYEGSFKPSFRGTGRGQVRGRGFQSSQSNRSNNVRFPSNRQTNSRSFCPGCHFLSQELQLDINFRHNPYDCPRKRSVLRILKAEEEHGDDMDEVDGYEEDIPHHTNELASEADNGEGKGSLNNNATLPKIQSGQPTLRINAVWKAKSPSIVMSLKDKSVTAIIDEGSEISAINSSIVNQLHLPTSRSVEQAKAAGSKKIDISSQTAQDVILSKSVNGSKIQWNLGQCLVVNNLGCDILIGEPAKQANQIVTHPSHKCISAVDVDNNKQILSYSCSSKSSDVSVTGMQNEKENLVCRETKKGEPVSEQVRLVIQDSCTVYPNDSYFLKVPEMLKSCAEVLVEPSEKVNFPVSGIYDVHHGMIKLQNMGPYPKKVCTDDVVFVSPLKKPMAMVNRALNIPFMEDDIQNSLHSQSQQDCQTKHNRVNNSSTAAKQISSMGKIYDINRHNMSQFYSPHTQHLKGDIDKVVIDPDNILPKEFRDMFRDITLSYKDIISETPGRYNGFYGQVNCALTLSGTPPPSVKPRLPNYSEDKMRILADKMDEMEQWGVIVKPESIGVVPTHVHPCILVPKEDGKFRLVTDFRSIQSHVLPLPTTMPTTQDAMAALASADYHIELDFSNFYWQNSIPREDSAKLAICHPYEGLRVYVVSPQGLRNSAEYGSEILARIYGDMVKEKKCTRIADQLYILGGSLMELSENFKLALQKARNANLTFKPSKVVICPKSTVILGWKKTDHTWFPTDHVLSPLSLAEPPSTVKKLRGWLGAFRQVAKTIPNHAILLQPFEKLVGGKNSKDRIVWTPELLDRFKSAKNSIKTAAPITIPRRTDRLKIFPDWSQDADAVGGRLIIERVIDGKKTELHGGEFSARLKGAQVRWTPCEKECLAIKLLVAHYQPFIRESLNCTTVFTDNIVSVHAWNAIKAGKISTSSRVASFISTMCENNVDIVHFPGEMTKVADYNSRNPVHCNQSKCQTCNFIEQEIVSQQSYVRNISHSSLNDPLLVERPTWLALQKQDPSLSQLYNLIRTGGVPEKKMKNRNLKLLHNMYRRGTLFVANDGLLQVKNVDMVHDIEYKAILIPDIYVSSVVQSLHVKLNHPSPYQLNKHMSRNFFAIGMSKTIHDISGSCDTCVRLKTLPKPALKGSTVKNDTFGTNFSADILIEKGQHILICREKLSQLTLSCFVQDETKSSIEDGLVLLLINFIPEQGSVVQVDPGPSLVSLASDENSRLSQFNISLDIGRVLNKQKNPIAENAIKEFRKEWLRLKPEGSMLSEVERAIVTATINKRIRINGLSPKEFMLKRSLKDHSPIVVNDAQEGNAQFDRRQCVNEKKFVQDSIKVPMSSQPQYKIGDLVYLTEGLSKSRAREQFIVVKAFIKNSEQWLVVRKCQRGFRNKEYLLRASEVFLAPQITITENNDDDDDDLETFQGFHESIFLDKRDKIKDIVDNLQRETSTTTPIRGRPAKLKYPHYLNKLPQDVSINEEDERCQGFGDSHVQPQKSKSEKLKQVIKVMEEAVQNEDNENFYGFSGFEAERAEKRRDKLSQIIDETSCLINKIRNARVKTKTRPTYAWDYQQWMSILESDTLEENLPDKRDVRILEVDEQEPVANDLSYDDSEFYSFAHVADDTVQDMIDEEVTTIKDFNVHYELHSTPVRSNLKSATDPCLLDTIPVVSSSESSLEEDELSDAESKIDWDSDIPLGPVRLESRLDKILQDCPELQPIQEGRVYDMQPILQNIHDSQTNSQQPQVQELRRSRRNLPRVDYKLLNNKGLSSQKQ